MRQPEQYIGTVHVSSACSLDMLNWEVASKHGPRTYHLRSTHVLSAPSVEHVTVGNKFKRRTESVRCALVGSTGHARHTHWGLIGSPSQPERTESSSCNKSATVFLRAPKSVRRRYSPRTDTHIFARSQHALASTAGCDHRIRGCGQLKPNIHEIFTCCGD